MPKKKTKLDREVATAVLSRKHASLAALRRQLIQQLAVEGTVAATRAADRLRAMDGPLFAVLARECAHDGSKLYDALLSDGEE
jgi:hypothetical protein